MSDVIWVAGISSLGALLGAGLGSYATVFGPINREKKDREARAADEFRTARYRSAQAFLEAVSLIPTLQTRPERMQVEVVRLSFVANLRRGEAAADAFAANLVERVHENKSKDMALDIVQVGGSMLLAWLRGEIPTSKLTNDELTTALFPERRP